jgi:hypothetical protein
MRNESRARPRSGLQTKFGTGTWSKARLQRPSKIRLRPGAVSTKATAEVRCDGQEAGPAPGFRVQIGQTRLAGQHVSRICGACPHGCGALTSFKKALHPILCFSHFSALAEIVHNPLAQHKCQSLIILEFPISNPGREGICAGRESQPKSIILPFIYFILDGTDRSWKGRAGLAYPAPSRSPSCVILPEQRSKIQAGMRHVPSRPDREVQTSDDLIAGADIVAVCSCMKCMAL